MDVENLYLKTNLLDVLNANAKYMGKSNLKVGDIVIKISDKIYHNHWPNVAMIAKIRYSVEQHDLLIDQYDWIVLEEGTVWESQYRYGTTSGCSVDNMKRYYSKLE